MVSNKMFFMFEFLILSSNNTFKINIDCNWTRIHNHLVHKRTLDHLAKLANLASSAKWLSIRL